MNCPLCNYEEIIDLEPTMEVLRENNYVYMYDKKGKTIDIINPRNNKKAKFYFAFRSKIRRLERDDNSIKECKNCKEIIMRYDRYRFNQTTGSSIYVENMTMFRTTITVYKDNNSYINIHDLEGDYYRTPGGFGKYRLSDLIIKQIKSKNYFRKCCNIL